MTTSLSLLGIFVVAGYLAPLVLRWAQWPYRSPRLGTAAWLMLAATCALAGMFAVATVAVPAAVAGHGLADWWHACLGQWRHYYANTSMVTVGVAALVAVILVGRLVRSTIGYRRSVRAVRRHQHAGLSLLDVPGRRHVVVVPHPVPAAYCVPGRPGRVVMTDSAVRVLDPDQVEAVLAHERAHLAGRHAMWVGVATVLVDAFGGLAPVFRRAARETATLVEMVADDAAAVICPAPRVAQALLALADGMAPRTALMAGGTDLASRIRRLNTPQRPLGRVATLAMLVTLGLGLVVPAAAVAAPIAVGVIAATCGHPGDT